MSKEAVFTMKLEPELRASFLAEAAREDRPASQVVRELMREYVAQRREAKAYHDYLAHKVAVARAQKADGRGASNDEVEAKAKGRRKEWLRRAEQAGQ